MWPSFQRDATKPQEKKKKKEKKKRKRNDGCGLQGKLGGPVCPTAWPKSSCRCNNGRLMRTRSCTLPLLPDSAFFFRLLRRDATASTIRTSRIRETSSKAASKEPRLFFFPLSFPIHDRSPFRSWSACRPDSCNTRTRIIIAIII